MSCSLTFPVTKWYFFVRLSLVSKMATPILTYIPDLCYINSMYYCLSKHTTYIFYPSLFACNREYKYKSQRSGVADLFTAPPLPPPQKHSMHLIFIKWK